jgi:hypothetical protein
MIYYRVQEKFVFVSSVVFYESGPHTRLFG